MERELEGGVVSWRGPAPHHFVAVPEDVCADLQEVAALVSCGWGMVPVRATLSSCTWDTSLFPQDGGSLVPLRAHVRTVAGIVVHDLVRVRLEVGA